MAKEYPEMNVLKYYHAMGPEAYKELLRDVVIRVGGYYLGAYGGTYWFKVTKITNKNSSIQIHFKCGTHKWLSWFWMRYSSYDSPREFLGRLAASNPNALNPVTKLKELDLSKPNA